MGKPHEEHLDWANASWKQSVHVDKKRIRLDFIVRYKNCPLYVCYGQIKETNDGRFRWWKRGSSGCFRIEREGSMEGVASSLEEAKIKATEDIYD